MSRKLAVLMFALATIGPAWAQSSADPHMTVGQLSGDFVLHYFGTMGDGTVCPPSPNQLNYALEHTGGLIYAHSVSVDSSADPELTPAFAEGAYCELAFTGAAVVRRHHGTQISILPASVSTVPMVDGDTDGDAPFFSGKFSVHYYPVMCLVPPCPPGSFSITDANGDRVADVKQIVVQGADGSIRPNLGGESAEGHIWLENDGKRAILRVDRVVEGLWK